MSETVVELPQELTIAACQALHERLVGALDQAQAVVLEAGAVERIDSAALQTLAAFFTSAATVQGVEVSWQAPPGCVREAAAMLGLAPLLALDEA